MTLRYTGLPTATNRRRRKVTGRLNPEKWQERPGPARDLPGTTNREKKDPGPAGRENPGQLSLRKRVPQGRSQPATPRPQNPGGHKSRKTLLLETGCIKPGERRPFQW